MTIKVLFGQKARDYESMADRVADADSNATAWRNRFNEKAQESTNRADAYRAAAANLADAQARIAALEDQVVAMSLAYNQSIDVGVVERAEQTDPYEVTAGGAA